MLSVCPDIQFHQTDPITHGVQGRSTRSASHQPSLRQAAAAAAVAGSDSTQPHLEMLLLSKRIQSPPTPPPHIHTHSAWSHWPDSWIWSELPVVRCSNISRNLRNRKRSLRLTSSAGGESSLRRKCFHPIGCWATDVDSQRLS